MPELGRLIACVKPMDIQINEPIKSRIQLTPWALTAAAGAGFMSFFVCRALFKQTRSASLLQSYIVLASALGALKAVGTCCESACKDEPK